MDENSGLCPQCPCIITRKKIVMTNLALCSLALVVWTLAVTSKAPESKGAASNMSMVFVDDTKPLKLLNFSLSSVMKSKAAKMAVKPVPTMPPTKPPLVRLKHIENDDDELMCNCLCKYNVTLEEMKTAIDDLIRERDSRKPGVIKKGVTKKTEEEEQDWTPTTTQSD